VFVTCEEFGEKDFYVDLEASILITTTTEKAVSATPGEGGETGGGVGVVMSAWLSPLVAVLVLAIEF